jgi:hypothetical protein
VLNSIFQHVKGVLDGLPLPGQSWPLTCHVIPPPVEPLGDKPIAYLTLAGKAQFKRQTMPRGAGFMGIDWPVGITVDFQDLSSDPNLEQAFYLISDAILIALLATPMPVFITDPTTQVQTQLTSIGEDGGVQLGNLVTTASNRVMLFRGQVTTTLREKTQTGAYLGTATGGPA